jgi:hypothetical protein
MERSMFWKEKLAKLLVFSVWLKNVYIWMFDIKHFQQSKDSPKRNFMHEERNSHFDHKCWKNISQ